MRSELAVKCAKLVVKLFDWIAEGDSTSSVLLTRNVTFGQAILYFLIHIFPISRNLNTNFQLNRLPLTIVQTCPS